jgi:hypothetical protein
VRFIDRKRERASTRTGLRGQEKTIEAHPGFRRAHPELSFCHDAPPGIQNRTLARSQKLKPCDVSTW